MTAREFRELCYELGLFVDTDDVFSTVVGNDSKFARSKEKHILANRIGPCPSLSLFLIPSQKNIVGFVV